MKELIAALLLASTSRPVSLSNEQNIANAKNLIGDVNVSDGTSWHTLFTKEYIQAVFQDAPQPLKVGDTVTAPYKDGVKEGIIKAIGFQVDGLGNKYYSEEDLKKL